jgi:Zn-finger nucleic acid-binding protein
MRPGPTAYEIMMSVQSRDRLCPRDGSPLEIHQWREVAYASCPHCHGFHIGRSELERMIRFHADSPHTEPPPAADGIKVVEGTALCSCREQPLMKRVTRDGLSLDVCPGCGAFWFDSGEIEAYVTARRSAQATEGLARRPVSTLTAGVDIGELVWGLLEVFGDLLGGLSWD